MARKMLVLGAALLPVAGVAAVLLPRDGDALGRLVTAKLPGETVSYGYNVRNALTSITSPRFSQQLRYAAGAANPCYNGNIAEAVTQGNKYAYTYDNANRLTSAKYTPSAGDADYSATYAYDRNSNITALTRKGLKDIFGNYGPVDDLTMLYDGNRLWRVSDHADEVLLENSGNLRTPENFDPSETQFGYDSNGNTVKDLSRNIEKMDYNPINLPLSARLVQGTDRLTGRKTNQSISYTYDASGIRHRVIHATQPLLGTRPMRIATADTTDYVGNYVIRNGQIDKIMTPYGYLQDGKFHTFLHDYQGNVAAVVVGDSVAQRNSYYPYGLPHVTGLIKLQSPSATSVTDNPYKYGGKEFDTFGGTDLYDFHARYHAPSTGRFMTIDPMAEDYYGYSIYLYCMGNPIALTDPTGMKVDTSELENATKIPLYASSVDELCGDLTEQTGVTIEVSNGMLSYQKSDDGSPIVATNPETGQMLGSKTARNLVLEAIDKKETVTVAPGKSSVKGLMIGLSAQEINTMKAGAHNVSEKTLGYGMTFMHEYLHTEPGGGLVDDHSDSGIGTGDVVDKMNQIRKELNEQGLNYGIRMNYSSFPLPTGEKIIPFDYGSFSRLKMGRVPIAKNKYIKY